MTTNPDEQPALPEPTEKADAVAVEIGDAAPVADSEPSEASEASDVSLAGEAMNLLSEHKGKLAIGVAATLGMMVYYGWREKRLAKADPEEYARLQRLKAVVRHSDDQPKPRAPRKTAARPQAAEQAAPAAADVPAPPAATPDNQLAGSSTPE
jgi:hypothetical protein